MSKNVKTEISKPKETKKKTNVRTPNIYSGPKYKHGGSVGPNGIL